MVLFLAEPDTARRGAGAGRAARGPRLLVLNKVDPVQAEGATCCPLLAAWNETGVFEELVPISALHGDGIDRSSAARAWRACRSGRRSTRGTSWPPSPERFFVGEIIRERIFERFEKEIPYATEVTVEEFNERPGARDYIEAWIHVEQESQKAILIGRDGAAIAALGEEARGMIEEFLGRPVYLSLRVG